MNTAWGDFLQQEIRPAVAADPSVAVPEAEWRRRTKVWEASNAAWADREFGVSKPGRVFISLRAPLSIGVAGRDESIGLLAYLNGGAKPTGETFKRLVLDLASRYGIACRLGAAEPETDAERAERERRAAARQAQLAEQRRRGDEADRASVAKARELWRSAEGSKDHPAARAYFEARGVDLSRLPGGVLPASIRYAESAPFGRPAGPDEDGSWVEEEPGPAILCAVLSSKVSRDGKESMAGVQRIFLDPGGEPRKREGVGSAKLGLGRLEAGFCPLVPPSEGENKVEVDPSTLVLCEGVETGMAIYTLGRAWRVYCCISTSGLSGFVLPEAVADPETRLERVIVAGDYDSESGPEHDRHRPGERYAVRCAERLAAEHPHLEVTVALPSHELVPEMIGADGGVL